MKSPRNSLYVKVTLASFCRASLLSSVVMLMCGSSSLAQSPVPGHISRDEWARLKNASPQHRTFTREYEIRRDDVLSLETSEISDNGKLIVNGTLFVDNNWVRGAASSSVHVNNGGRLILSNGRMIGMTTTIDEGGVLIIADPDPAKLPTQPPTSYRYSTIECFGEIKGAGTIASDVNLRNGGSILLDAIEPPLIKYTGSASLITITGSLNSTSGSLSEAIKVTNYTGGTPPTYSITFGQLAVYGTVAINGAQLSVTTTPYVSGGTSYYPPANAVFDMIVATSVTGTGLTPNPVNDTNNGSYSHAKYPATSSTSYRLTRQ